MVEPYYEPEEILKSKLACPEENCGSSDALVIYEKHAHCYSCNTRLWPDQLPKEYQDYYTEAGLSIKTHDNALQAPITEDSLETQPSYTPDNAATQELLDIVENHSCRGFKDRGILKPVAEHYGCRVSYDEYGEIDKHYYIHYKDLGGGHYKPVGAKVRILPKKFYSIGDTAHLFGQHLFEPGGKRIVITEGELDALSIAQMSYIKYKTFYPAVSIPNGVNAEKVLLKNRKYLRSFEEIVIFFDQDEAGQTSAQKVAKLLGVDKCKIATLAAKDPNEVLKANPADHENNWKPLYTAVWNAATWSPAGLLDSDQLWERYLENKVQPSIKYPPALHSLNKALKGIRQHEITMFISGTGTGKSVVSREVLLHLHDMPNRDARIIALEESAAETFTALAGMYHHVNIAETDITKEQAREAWEVMFKNGNLHVFEHYESEGNMLDTLEYFCASGATDITLDHITLWAAEENLSGRYNNENAKIDYLMSGLRKLAQKYPVHFFLISQLRKSSSNGQSFEEGVLPSLDDIKGCLAKGTPVLKSDGKIESVENICVGDTLMGGDGTPRKVLKLCRGISPMYRITMKTSGDAFICNEDHVLTLSYNYKVFDITVKDFLKKSAAFQERCKQHYSAGYELPEQEVPIAPYALGAWLGDGSKAAFRLMDASNAGIAERVATAIDAVIGAPKDINREYFNFNTGVKGEMLDKLRELGVFHNKHIPNRYRFNSQRNRLELLAGLLDTDGTYSDRDGIFYFYQKDNGMANTVKEIARSLGFYSTVRQQTIKGEYASNGSIINVVTIAGDRSRIPAQKMQNKNKYTNSLKLGITVEKLDVAQYYGFTLDGDGRFLLGNHIITHNSGSIKQVCHNIIGGARNLMAEDDLERNTIQLAVLKSRFSGNTGLLPPIYFSKKENRLYSSTPAEYLVAGLTESQRTNLEEDGMITTL